MGKKTLRSVYLSFFDFGSMLLSSLRRAALCKLTVMLALLLLFLFSGGRSLYAQDGPAGVGSTDGASSLRAWYRADRQVTADGSGNVSAWNNSVNVARLNVAASGTQRPRLVNGALNWKPTVRFSGAQLLETGQTIDGTNFPQNAASSFVVMSTANTSQSSTLYGTRPLDSYNRFSCHLPWGANYYFDFGDCATTQGRITGALGIGANQYSIWSFTANSARGKSVFVNGSLRANVGGAGPFNNHSNYTFGLGDGFSGDVAEVIVFNDRVNDAQRNIVENYLNAKYGIGISNDIYSSTTYTSDVAGIGKESDGGQALSSSAGFSMSTNGASYGNGEYFMFGHNGATNDESNIASDSKVTVSGAQAAWGRSWYIDRTGTGSNMSARLSFNIPSAFDGGFAPGGVNGYVLLYRSLATGSYSVVNVLSKSISGDEVVFDVASTSLADGYYTLGTTNTLQSPLQGDGPKTFYSLKSGSWDDPATWTLDPSGTQYLNPNGLTPSTSTTASQDKVVILSGRTVTVSSDGKQNEGLNVVGTLDFGATTGHSFTTVDGSGRIRLAGDNFPAGDASDFITAGRGEGTVEYYGSSRSLTTSRTFFNVEVNMSSGSTLGLLANYSINGNLTVNSGTLSFGNGTSTVPLTVNVMGNMQVGVSGNIVTGTANARHQLNLYGDFTNSGDVRFTNRAAANYTSEATDGIVDVNFLNSSANQSVLCKGLTNFYRIKIDKGTDMTYALNLDATAPANFNLLGFANQNYSGAAQPADNQNALGLVHGTVRIGNSIVIPTLSVASTYTIPESAQLWISGGTVQKNSGQALAIYGKVKVSTGLLEAKVQNGITLCNNGSLDVNGGTVNTNQIHTGDTPDGPHNGAFVQTGGLVNVVAGTINTDHYVFSLASTASVFNMSGGTLKVNNISAGDGAIFINSDPENTKVSGGTVVGETITAEKFKITSRAPFWNLELTSSAAGSGLFRLGAAANIGSMNVNLAAQPLRVLNDLKLWGQESGGAAYRAINFDPETSDVYIGGSMRIENGATYRAVSGGTAPYDAIANQPTSRNTTYFNKTAGTSAVEELYWGAAAAPLELGNLVVDRTDGYEVKVTSSNTRPNESVAVDVNGTASVLSGILNQNLYTIRTWGAIVNNGRMGTWYPGVTPSHAQIQMVENPSLSLTTSSDAVFGNVQVNVTPPAVLSLSSDTYIERMEYVKGLIYLKGYNLKVDNLWNLPTGIFENSTLSSYLKILNSGYSGLSMIYTDGKASDGGLTLKVTANSQNENESNILNNFGPITYPIGFTPNGGTTLYFRPAQMVVKNYSDDGYVTIRPVSGFLQTTNQSGGEVLQHYWRVSHSGFSTKPTVSYRFYYRNQKGIANVDLVTGANKENLYVPGKVFDESPYTRLYETANDIIKNFGASNNSRFITVNGSSTGGLFTSSSTGITLENANYTAGEQNRFTGSVLIYYSRDAADWGMWNHPDHWTRSDILNSALAPHDSRQPASTTVPGAGDVAVIGWIPWTDTNRPGKQGQPHSMWVTDTRQVAEVVFTKMTDASGNPVPRVYRSNFQFRPTLTINGIDNYDGTTTGDTWGNIRGYNEWHDNGALTAKLVKGEGLFWNRQSDPDYTKMDIGDFARQDSSYVIYENFSNNRVINRTPPLFPNLYISNDNWGANDRDFTFANNLATTGNIELLGNVNLVLPTGATGNITVGRNLVMFDSGQTNGGAEIAYGNSGTPRRVTVKGDLLIKTNNSGINVRNPNATAPLVDHELHVEGNIIQGTPSLRPTGLNLWSGANNDRVTLYLDGPNNMTYTLNNGTAPNLYRLVVNKGSSSATTALFNNDYILNGPTSGAGVAKALELRNGTFITNNPTARVLNLSTGNDYFEIPSTAGLDVRGGTVRVSGNSGIALDGKLTISGGTLDMVTGGGNNSIEYSASGNAAISISGASSLSVGGQIRRSLTSEEGILSYTQTGGTVVVGQNAATANDRGVFEILNAGSSFTMTGGDLFIARAQQNPQVSAFYFNPETYNIGLAANLNIGHSSTPAAQVIGIYAGKPLPKLRVNNQSGRNPTAKLEVVPATITSNLTVDAGAVFDANGLDLTLRGDMTCLGSFVPRGNTTFFSGGADQTITSGGAAINFFNVDKDGSNNVILANNTPLLIANELLMRAGSFTTNNNTVTVGGNVLNDATHMYGGSGDGIVMGGASTQTLTGNGTFGKLTIFNSNGVNVPVGNQLTISNSLKMNGGVFNIGKNRLDLGPNAIIENPVPFSATNMIVTNISFTDNGVRKFFRSGAQPIFTYPVGSVDKYTPVTIKIDGNTSAIGSITVTPANEMHPSVKEDAETGTQIVDADNALQYYWTMKATSLRNFSGTATMKFLDEDIRVTSPYTAADYFTARLLSDGSGMWNKYSKADFDEGAAKVLRFTFSNTDERGVSGDYTAGAGDNTLNGAIPDKVQKYETVSNGDWTVETGWTPNVSGGPRGAIAKINPQHTVDVSNNGISGYMTEVFGTLKLYSTSDHRLGIVNGNGTIYSEIGEVPAAVYDSFFSSSGGTLEFGGAAKNYEFLGNIFEVNNLKLSGSGERRLPNNNLLLNGDLTIAGQSGLNLLNYYNRKVSVEGDIIRSSGTFSAGTGANATFSLVGSLAQNITGSFSNSNAFNNLEVNNSNDVNIVNDVEVNRELLLTSGLIDVTTGSLFRLNYGAFVTPVAGSSSSFVNGVFTKEMMTGNSFTFPVGSNLGTKAYGPLSLLNVSGPAGINDWSASYTYNSPNTIGSVNSFESPITTVSNSEYWKVQAPAGGQAVLRINLDGSSDVASTITDLNNLRIAGWNSVTSKWEVVGSGASVSGSSTNGAISTTAPVNFGSYSYFTLASITPLSASSASFTSPATVNLCSGNSTTLTVAFSGTPPWVLTYRAGATTITAPAQSSSPYSFMVSPTASTTYTLMGITANGVAGTITGTSTVNVNVSPKPVVSLSSNDADNHICEGTSITFTATSGLNRYTFRDNGTPIANDANNSISGNTYTAYNLSPGVHSIDVIGTNAGGCATTSSALVVTVNPDPVAAGTITGAVSVCKGVTRTYTVPAITNATSYVWTVNGVVNAETTSSLSVKLNTAGTTTITVRGRNSCGDGATSSISVAVSNNATAGDAGAITGDLSVCKGGAGYSYSVPSITNATSYIWTYTGTGATINGTGSTVSVDFAPTATAGVLRVAGTNGCSTGATSPSTNIAVNTPPTATISPLSPAVCSGSSLSLVATPAGGSPAYASYAWSGTGAALLNSTTVNNPSLSSSTGGSYDLTYTVTDSKGCIGTATTTVTVHQAPVAVAGPDATSLCTGTSPIQLSGASASGSYSGTATWSGANGSWTQNPDPALATFTPSTAKGSTTATLTLMGANGCSTVTDSRTIEWSKAPDQPGAFTSGSTTVCKGDANITYTVSSDALATSYSWAYSGTGATIVPSANSATISFSASATSGTLSVTATNSCGTSPARTMAVTVNQCNPLKPETPTTASATVCHGTASTDVSISTDPAGADPNMYYWRLNPASAGTVSSTTKSATITWNAAFSGTVLVFVNAQNASGYSPNSDALSIDVVKVDGGEVETSIGNPACYKLSTTLNITNKTAASSTPSGTVGYSWEYLLQTDPDTTPSTWQNASGSTSSYSISTLDIGAQKVLKMQIRRVATSGGCSATSNTITVYRQPITGATYHIGNNTSK